MNSPRPYNFSPGPSTLPPTVLEAAAAEMLNWQGTGMGVMEVSHRGAAFTALYQEVEARMRRVLAVPAHFKILFMQGGAVAQNALLPLNLASRSPARVLDYLVTGSWSKKSEQEALRYGQVNLVTSSEAQGYTHIPEPSTWQLSQNAAYVHLCSNETVHGVEFHEFPNLAALGSDAPLVVDCSSHIASRTINWGRVGLAYAGAQKNLGIAGLTLVFVREDLLGLADKACPTAFNYQVVADNGSMYNTPPTFAIYITNLVLKWLEEQGGIAAIEKVNVAKAKLLYSAIEASVLYENRVHPSCRSRMNVPFFLRDEKLNTPFLEAAQERGLLQLKGHKMVGGMRASIYNAMPLPGVEALVGFMREFEKTHG